MIASSSAVGSAAAPWSRSRSRGLSREGISRIRRLYSGLEGGSTGRGQELLLVVVVAVDTFDRERVRVARHLDQVLLQQHAVLDARDGEQLCHHVALLGFAAVELVAALPIDARDLELDLIPQVDDVLRTLSLLQDEVLARDEALGVTL